MKNIHIKQMLFLNALIIINIFTPAITHTFYGSKFARQAWTMWEYMRTNKSIIATIAPSVETILPSNLSSSMPSIKTVLLGAGGILLVAGGLYIYKKYTQNIIPAPTTDPVTDADTNTNAAPKQIIPTATDLDIASIVEPVANTDTERTISITEQPNAATNFSITTEDAATITENEKNNIPTDLDTVPVTDPVTDPVTITDADTNTNAAPEQIILAATDLDIASIVEPVTNTDTERTISITEQSNNATTNFSTTKEGAATITEEEKLLKEKDGWLKSIKRQRENALKRNKTLKAIAAAEQLAREKALEKEATRLAIEAQQEATAMLKLKNTIDEAFAKADTAVANTMAKIEAEAKEKELANAIAKADEEKAYAEALEKERAITNTNPTPITTVGTATTPTIISTTITGTPSLNRGTYKIEHVNAQNKHRSTPDDDDSDDDDDPEPIVNDSDDDKSYDDDPAIQQLSEQLKKSFKSDKSSK